MVNSRVLALLLMCGALAFLVPVWLCVSFLELHSVRDSVRGGHRAFFMGVAVLHLAFSAGFVVQAVRLWRSGQRARVGDP